MSGSLSFNPTITTNAGGTFNVSSLGLIQGTAYADPAARYALSGGVLASTETLPLWGGVGISAAIPTPITQTVLTPATPGPSETLGEIISRATSVSTTGAAGSLTGFSTFDQAHNWINSPQSPVPLAGTGNYVSFYRLGSGIRLAVACDPALASLEGAIETSQVSWDFVGQKLVPYNAAWAANAITGATWTGGIATFTTTTSHGVAVGETYTISGIVATGGTSSYNGTYIATTGTTGSTLKGALASTGGTYSSGGTLVAGGGILPVKVLDIAVGNCMTVSYNAATGFAAWNRSGSCAVILL
jgi:hypothetical protein